MRPTAASVAEEVAALKMRMEAMESAAAKIDKSATETHQKVAQLYDALIVPEPGQEHGLLHRTAKVASAIESGERVAGWAVKIASVLAAIGVIAASIRIGVWPDGR
jgi:hypothetical protein